MRPMAAGAAEVRFRGIYPNRLRPVLRQGERHDTRAAADVQNAIAPPDADKLQEGARQAMAPSPHEVFVDIRIGRLEWEDKGAHRNLDCTEAQGIVARLSARSLPCSLWAKSRTSLPAHRADCGGVIWSSGSCEPVQTEIVSVLLHRTRFMKEN